ncbi:hypothetical protein HELRODRAFT_169802 [Helobdella robusta]|uniref:Uncharacterized protein n=1 Tax=Helobdella robusta TaxID=6412 RepID=T1F2C1_HELRO|nr:hypothetical protein HELRODRAFT_169802 [Helobdella robusta]ESO08074.1 hypothetical protein HELRODRAFT_169802 [Helobdella robusta]
MIIRSPILTKSHHLSQQKEAPTALASTATNDHYMKLFAYSEDRSCMDASFPQEVYVVYMKNRPAMSPSASSWSWSPVVVVDVRPRTNQTFAGNISLVLASKLDITWDVILHDFYSYSPINIYHSETTSVRYNDENMKKVTTTDFRMKNHSPLNELRKWVTRNVGQINNTIRINVTRVNVSVGIDSKVDVCQPRPTQEKPVDSCELKWDTGLQSE